MKKEDSILLIGIGNCGRQDDGLGWSFLDIVSPKLPKNIDVEYRYQLQIEDAELISHYESVYFIDASKNSLEEGFFVSECFPKETHSFSSHALPPETILFLSKSVYNKAPKSFIIGVSGKEYQLEIGLTERANSNLEKAVSYFYQNILYSSNHPKQANNYSK